jgi:hypothetical protein
MRLAPLITSIGKLDGALAEYRVHSANTYTRSQFTLETVTRELDLGEKLWDLQYVFLQKTAPELIERLRPVSNSGMFHLLRYLRAKLSGSTDQKQHYAAFIQHVARHEGSANLWFWRITRYLPNMLFAPAMNVAMGQSALKRWIARFRGLI